MVAGAVALDTTAAAALSLPAMSTDFNPTTFPHLPKIDNKWVRLIPGTEFVQDGIVVEGSKSFPHRIVTIVTGLTKVIDGVRTIVVWDRDYQSGKLQESELFFEAQDEAGNVWNLGEYPEVYEAGKFKGAPSTWISGIRGAKPGILMRSDPRTGTSSYSEGRAPKIGFFDEAKVSQTGAHTCVPVGCFNQVLVVDEWSPLSPSDGHQLKYYAPGVGNVRVEAKGGKDQEVLTLTSVSHLNPDALQDADDGALRLESRAYHVSKDYRTTLPIEGGS